MMRLSPRYRMKVPHSLAILGALLLLVSTLAGVGGATATHRGPATAAAQTALAEGQAESGGRAAESIESVPSQAVSKNKRFRANLFLFRR